MNARILAIMGYQWGLVTRRQAIESGASGTQVDRWVRTGRWIAVRRGVYADRSYVATLTGHPEQRLLADRAASLRVAAPHVLSHHSAAYLLQLPVLHEPDPVSHLTRPGIVGTHRRHDIVQHLAPYPDDQALIVRGMPVLGMARTALDIARHHGYEQGLVAADSALRMGVTRRDLMEAKSQMWCWPGSTVMHDVVASASPLSDSAGETLMRVIVESLGFGTPELQFGITADGRTAWCDMRLGRHVFEFDGMVKYLGPHDGGYAERPATDVLREEKGRQDFLSGFKLGVSRAIWPDVFGSGIARTRERFRRDYLDTCARFGTSIDDLAPYRPRGPRPRPLLRAAPYRLLGWEQWAA